MHTEISKCVIFLAPFLSHKIPRLKVCIYLEHLANNLLNNYKLRWDCHEPTKHEASRILHLSNNSSSEIINKTATDVGLSLNELLSCFVEGLKISIHINPGEVFYFYNTDSSPVLIWLGDPINADFDYKASLSSTLPSYYSNYLDRLNILNTDFHVHLDLVSHQRNGKDSLMFRFTNPVHPPFTAETFARTKFGSYRDRPDSEHINRLQRKIVAYSKN